MSDDRVGRIRATIRASIPDDDVRRAAMELFAYAIENADEERGDAWIVRETRHGLLLVTGRLYACKVSRGGVEISVMGPISEEVRAALGAHTRENEEWKAVPGGVSLSFPLERAALALELLKDPFDKFVDRAMERIRRTVSLEDHVPEAVACVAAEVGRELPQPTAAVDLPRKADEDDDEDAGPAHREPRVRGRAPIFDISSRPIASLIDDVGRGVIALPDLQRPFVWEDRKVRNLLDSLFVGFPVGTLVLWRANNGVDARAVGTANDPVRASTLIIDGQQRLTSLYAILRGVEVVDKDGARRRITIAFRPRDGRFEVADAAIRKDPEFIQSVTDLWLSNSKPKITIRRELLQRLRDAGRTIDGAYEEAVEENLDRVYGVRDYQIPVVEIRTANETQDATEEDIADIFVRINNEGTRLGQADFVLTLLSVFHGGLRDSIEKRAPEMSREGVVPVDTQQLLRAACAVGFGRARMSAVYRYLRGVDAATGETDLAGRKARIERLDRAATECLDGNPWRDYNLRVVRAGFATSSLVASPNAIINGYALYIRGRRAGVPKPRLDEVISRWVFGSLMTARYSASSETVFEEDLARVSGPAESDPDAFVAAVESMLTRSVEGDYWTHALVGALETQRGRAPAALAFRAAQIALGARALFSDQPLQNLFTAPAAGKRAASEVHHLFPQAWLLRNGVTERRQINQVANVADIGWFENASIGSRAPREYVPRLRDELAIGDDRWGRMCAEHALATEWHAMDYETFLRDRRARMAELIRVGFRTLGGEADSAPAAPPWFLPGAELVWQEIAEIERALRTLVRESYGARFGAEAPQRIESALPEGERASLTRALRARPAGADPLGVVDYLYLAQLPQLLFAVEIWPSAREKVGGGADAKQRLSTAIQHITPVRNEIAHVREVPAAKLQRASVACKDVVGMLASR